MVHNHHRCLLGLRGSNCPNVKRAGDWPQCKHHANNPQDVKLPAPVWRAPYMKLPRRGRGRLGAPVVRMVSLAPSSSAGTSCAGAAPGSPARASAAPGAGRRRKRARHQADWPSGARLSRPTSCAGARGADLNGSAT